MEQLNSGGTASGKVRRRTVIKGAAWSIPVIAAAVAAPMSSASGEAISATSPAPSGVCSPIGDFTVSVTANGVATAGIAVTVTLPVGFSWPGGLSNPQVLLTDAGGTVTVTGVTGPSTPGTYAVTASVTSNGTTISTSIPVFVQGTWLVNGPGYTGSRIRNVYTNPADVNNLGSTSCVAYCIEHTVSAPHRKVGYVGDVGSFIGSNDFATGVTTYNHLLDQGATFTAAQIQAKVEWIMRHSYPSVSLSAIEAATGQTGLQVNDVIEATQFAIWQYTDQGFIDANWPFGDGTASSYDQGKAVFTYLVNGAWNDTATAPSSCLRVVSSASAACTTPTGPNHIQSVAMLCDCV